MKKEHIHIGIPCGSGRLGVPITDFLANIHRLSAEPSVPYQFSWQILNGHRPVEYARNLLVGGFLRDTKAERLWFMDDDMKPPANALALLGVDADMAAPAAFAFNHATPDRPPTLKLCLFNYLEDQHSFECALPGKTGVTEMQVDGAGTAAMVIRRHVLEDRRLWQEGGYSDLAGKAQDCWQTDPDGGTFAPPIFKMVSQPNGKIMRGEDLDFCLRARALGYKLVGHYGVNFGHVKPVDLTQVAEYGNMVAKRATEQRVIIRPDAAMVAAHAGR